jgi:hypothetical protein
LTGIKNAGLPFLAALGQFLETTLYETGLAIMHPHTANYFMHGKPPQLTGNEHPNLVPYAIFPTKTDNIFIGVGNDGTFRKLAKEIGIDDVSRLPLDDWLTLNQLFTHAAVSFYIGYTRQSLPAEALCWIAPRGSEKRDKNGDFIATGERNRPPLLWADGTYIKKTEATSLLGFKFFEVYASTLKINARAVEKALQVLKMALPLGRRLWRCADKGGKYDKKIDGHLHKVFFTVSPFIGDMVHTGEIIINE